MHHAQGFRGMRSHQNFLKVVPEFGARRRVEASAGSICLNLVFGDRAETQSVLAMKRNVEAAAPDRAAIPAAAEKSARPPRRIRHSKAASADSEIAGRATIAPPEIRP